MRELLDQGVGDVLGPHAEIRRHVYRTLDAIVLLLLVRHALQDALLLLQSNHKQAVENVLLPRELRKVSPGK